MLAAIRSKCRSGAAGARLARSSRRSDGRWFHPRVEPLEDRRLLSLVPVLVRDINPVGSDSEPDWLTNVNGTLFITANDGTSGNELWKSDGTEAGTVRVKDILPGTGGSGPDTLTNVNGMLFFNADDGVSGRELWKSDGTEAGTVRVKDILPGSDGSVPGSLTNVDGTLFFTAADRTSGGELWKSDGTEAGTVRVKDILPGGYGSDPRSLTNINGTLFFNANDGTSGRELWKSDGTEAGTAMLTPAMMHYGTAATVLHERQRVLNLAYAAHPERFVHAPPAPQPVPTSVWINPPQTGPTQASPSPTPTPPNSRGGNRIHPLAPRPAKPAARH
jgi:ELWxxDGT repeat protein